MRNRLYTEDYSSRLLRLFGSDTNKVKKFKTITIQVTEDCNLACTYCYQTNKSSNKMTFPVAKKFIDLFLNRDESIRNYIDSYECLGLSLDFIGGEPFLAIDLIDEIVDYFRLETIRLKHPLATRYMINICSNGILYFNPKVQEFIKKNLYHLSFSISIDGNKKLHDSCRVFPNGEGSYDIAIKGVNHFRNVLGGKMGSKMTIAPENLNYVSEAVIALIENGYEDINFNCVYENVWKHEHAKELYYQLKKLADYAVNKNIVDSVYLSMLNPKHGHKDPHDKNWCGGDGSMLALDYKGDFYPCLRYMGSSLNNEQEPYIIGNINCGIGKSNEYNSRIKCLKCITKSSQSTKKCIECPIDSGCGWCSAYNYQIYGTPNKRATFICEMHQARIMATSYMWNKWYKKIGSTNRYSLDIPEKWAIDIIGEEEYLMLKEDSL